MIVLGVLLLVPIILFAMRRPTPSGLRRTRDKGVTYLEPSSDQPTPSSGPVNKADAKRAAERIPPS